MFFEQLPQQLVNGIILGSIYALLALGYTMVYGIIKLINFAHGDIYMIGAFVGYYAINSLKMNFWIALVFSMIVCAILGVVIEFLAYRPLRNSTRISALITAIGVSFFLEYIMVYFVGADTRSFPQSIKMHTYHLGSISVTNVQLLILVVALVINVNNTISFTFALGSSLAGAAGVLIGLYYNSIEPLMGMTPGIKAFVAAVLGGIGIIPGAALGGFVIGILETLSTAIGLSSYRDAIVYGVLIVILLVRPAGILGKNVKEKV